ncbi:MAG: hypothetical protein RLZZ136_981 [Pseudomonadota bacterium]
MIPLIVIRPQPGCSATVAAAANLGLDAKAFPLFAVSPQPWTAPPPDAADALLIGSANALRHGGSQLAALRHLAVYAVGEATATAALEAGFAVAATGSGGLQRVLDRIPAGTRVLRLAGADHVPLTPPPGVRLAARIIYTSVPQPMPDDLANQLAQGAVVLLHSGEAAAHFAAECARLGVPQDAVHLAALAPRVAEAADTGWASLSVAPTPQDAALLALAAQLCQSGIETRG